MNITDWLANEWQGMVAGGGLYALVREIGAFVLRLRAARLRGDTDPTNDAEAALLDDVAGRLDRK